ncbi:MAG: DUF2090 domain-containing protein [Acidobacteriota bacterium]
MTLGFDRPLYLLPFDHRESFESGLFGLKPPLSPEQVASVTAAKRLVYDGFQAAVAGGVPREPAAILVDEQFGADLLRDAASQGIMTACPAEKSGQAEFTFEYGEDFARHIETFAPTFCKVLVRYNPAGDKAMNRRQANRLRRLSEYLRGTERKLLFELLVPAEPAELEQLGGDPRVYDLARRPRHMVNAILELQEAGVEPDVWKVEGLDRAEDCANVVEAARRNGRDRVACIVLGRGADLKRVSSWLTTAAGVPGFVGFAVGRSTFWDALFEWRHHRLTRDAAVAQIARRYREWADIFELTPGSAAHAAHLTRRALRRWENEGGRL